MFFHDDTVLNPQDSAVVAGGTRQWRLNKKAKPQSALFYGVFRAQQTPPGCQQSTALLDVFKGAAEICRDLQTACQ